MSFDSSRLRGHGWDFMYIERACICARFEKNDILAFLLSVAATWIDGERRNTER